MDTDTTSVWKKQSYFDIYRNHQGYACHKWMHYPFIYDQIFARYLDSGKPLYLLEIGVHNGGSLEIWKKYLPPGSEIHGLDINPKCLELDFSSNIHFHLGSATDEVFLNHLFADKNFDIIIDDSSHQSSDIISAFLNLFKKINPGGAYIIEGLHASYRESNSAGLRTKISSIKFFKQFIDTLHFDYVSKNQFPKNIDITPAMKQYRQEIANISFFDSICSITRLSQTKNIPFGIVTNGNIFKVTPFDSSKEMLLKNKLQDIETTRLMYATTGNGSNTQPAMERKELLLANGIKVFNEGDYKTAIECFSTVMTKEPKNPLPCAYLAFICARQGLLQEARDFIAQSAKIAPERADLIAALGEVFLKNGNPSEAVEYLREAVRLQPNLFAAYSAFAQSLHLTGQSEEAVSILQTASNVPSNAQSSIQSTLLQILAECGDLSEFTKYSLRFSHGLPDALLAARCLARFEENGEEFLETLSSIQARLESVIHSSKNYAGSMPNESGLTRIAFMTGDFTSHHQFEQLYALFLYLPTERFFTLFITCFAHPPKDDMVHRCAMLADTFLSINEDKDDSAVEKLRALTPDILVNMEVCSPSERLAVFLATPVLHKFLWADAPIPPIAPNVRTLAGARLSVGNMLPTVNLPEMGEVFDLPELPFTDKAARKMGEPPVLGCLVPAAGIARNGWQFFAETLRNHPFAMLVINLEELGQAAQNFISAQFSSAGVDPARLVFISIRTVEEFCLAWQSIDLGLLPPVNPGGLALPSCLWMGRPCLVLDSILPWSQRPTAFLKALGREEWIATGTPHYVDLALQLAPPGQKIKPDPALRERMKALGLTDAKGFAHGFAEAMSVLP
ncbi:MAG: tetratricopeptide repeat protein [Betaproteobacteria bacterium]|nr:tetratricopeptide repeat protein [Betaproteobacteria bacterium]